MKMCRLAFICVVAALATVSFAAVKEKKEAVKKAGNDKSFCWKVTKGNNTLYLLGSVHLGTPDMVPLAKNVEDAFDASSYLFVEVDPSKVDQASMMQKLMYTPPDSITNHISAKTYAAILDFFKQYGTPEAAIAQLKPGAIAMMIELLKLTEWGYNPQFGIDMLFEPSDFVQVNAAINQTMIARALELLNPSEGDRILDLFCGLGNFTLPLSTLASEVVGIEGDQALLERATANAVRNKLSKASFYAADLNQEPGAAPWLRDPYDKVLVDPPRSGAEFILPHIAASGARRIVYVSCHPGTLARDAGTLVNELGFRLESAGIIDMFPQTAHVESIAVFSRKPSPK